MSDIVQNSGAFVIRCATTAWTMAINIEQLTYLLFLKMADERSVGVPKNCDWNSLKDKSGTALTDHYADILRKLREGGGLLGDIFAQSVPRFNNPCQFETAAGHDRRGGLVRHGCGRQRRCLRRPPRKS